MQRAAPILSLVATILVAPGCGGGEGDGHVVDGGPHRVLACFYDAAETSYNVSGNPDIQTRRVPATGLTVDGVNLGTSNCGEVLFPSEVTFGGNGYLTTEIYSTFTSVEGYLVYYAVPKDLEKKGLLRYVQQGGKFQGWGPNERIRYRALESADRAELERRAQEVWQQLQPIDLDPYGSGGAIVRTDPKATAGNGTVVMQRGAWGFTGTLEYLIGNRRALDGGTLEYEPGTADFDNRLLHAIAQSIGLVEDAPTPGSGFGTLGAPSFTQDEIRTLRVATNLAGVQAPQ